MKYLAMLGVVAALVVPNTLTAQQGPPDLGEENVFLLACQYATEIGNANDLVVRYCRRAAPDEIAGNKAVIHVKLGTILGPLDLSVIMHKSLWGVSYIAND